MKSNEESFRDGVLAKFRKAKGNQEKPFYRAGFALLAQSFHFEPIETSEDFWLYIMPLLALVVVAVAFQLARKRKKD